MGVLCMLIWMLHRNGGWLWLLEPVYGTFILWGGLIMYPTWRQVLWALCWPIMLRFSFCHFFTRWYLFSLFRFASSTRTRNLVVPAHRSLAMRQSFVLLGCRAWNKVPPDLQIMPTGASFVSAVKKMVRGVDASNWVIYLFLTHVFCFCSTHHVIGC
jgi:hypothetical protein